jgi:hypothetical protein
MAGGYHKMKPSDLANIQNDKILMKARKVAHEEFQSQQNGHLGKLISV